MSPNWSPFASANWSIPSTIQKRLLKFLLKRAIGQFLAEELDLNQLDLNLTNGQLQLKNLQLDVHLLNNAISDLPFTITNGTIGAITATVPWKNIWTGNCELQIENLSITLVALKKQNEKNSLSRSIMTDSNFMSSSIHFAGDFLRNEVRGDDEEEDDEMRKSIFGAYARSNTDNDDPSQQHQQRQQHQPPPANAGMEGLQLLAGVIDIILSRVKFVAKNTTFRLQHWTNASSSETDSPRCVNLDLSVPIISYSDDTPLTTPPVNLTDGDVSPPPFTQPIPESTKTITFEGFHIAIREDYPLENSENPEHLQSLDNMENAEISRQSGSVPLDQSPTSSSPESPHFPLIPDESCNTSSNISSPKSPHFPLIPDEPCETNDSTVQPEMTISLDQPEQPVPQEQPEPHLPENMSHLGQNTVIASANHKDNSVHIRIRQNTNREQDQNVSPPATGLGTSATQSSASTWEAACTVESLLCVLDPIQFAFLAEIASALNHNRSSVAGEAVIRTHDSSSSESQRSDPFSRGDGKESRCFEGDSVYHDAMSMPDSLRSEDFGMVDDLVRAAPQRAGVDSGSRRSSFGRKESIRDDRDLPDTFFDLDLEGASGPQSGSHVPKPNFSRMPSSNRNSTAQSRPPFSTLPTVPPPTSSAPPSNSSAPSPTTKFTLRLGNAQIYLLHMDAQLPLSPSALPNIESISHLDHHRVDIDQIHCELNVWNPDSSVDRSSIQKSQTELSFRDATIQEHINDKRHIPRSRRERENDKTSPSLNTDQYTPILTFDHTSDFSFGEPSFPVTSSDAAFYLRTETCQHRRGNLSPTTGSHGAIPVSKTHIDVSPLILRLDLAMMDRLWNYKLTMQRTATRRSDKDENGSNDSNNDGDTWNGGVGAVMEDLERGVNVMNDYFAPVRKQTELTIHGSVVRVLVLRPENRDASAEEKTTETTETDGDLFALGLLVEFVRPVLVPIDGSDRGSNIDPAKGPGREYVDTDRRGYLADEKGVQFWFSSMNVFLWRGEDEKNSPVPILTVSSPPESTLRSASDGIRRTLERQAITLPKSNIEFTVRSPATTSCQLESSQPPDLFGGRFFGAEEKVRNFKEEGKEEEMLVFKDRVIRNSIFVLVCQFARVESHISRSILRSSQNLIAELSSYRPGQSRNAENPTDGLFRKSEIDEDANMDRGLNGSESSPESDANLASVLVFAHEVDLTFEHADPARIEETRTYALQMKRIDVFHVVHSEGKPNTSYSFVDNEEFTMWDAEDHEGKMSILRKTTTATPSMLSMTIQTSLDPDLDVKETTLKLLLSGVTLQVSPAFSRWMTDLSGPARKIEEDPDPDQQNSFINLLVSLEDCSAEHNLENHPSSVVLLADGVKISSNIIPFSPTFGLKFVMDNLSFLAVDDVESLRPVQVTETSIAPVNVRDCWKTAGYVHLAVADYLEVFVRTNQGDISPKFDLELTNEKLTVETCADSYLTLTSLIAHLTAGGNGNESAKAGEEYDDEDTAFSDLLGGLDEEAFRHHLGGGTSSSESLGANSMGLVEEFYSAVEGENRNEEVGESVILKRVETNERGDVRSKPAIERGYALTKEEIVRNIDDDPQNEPEEFRIVDDHFSMPALSEADDARIVPDRMPPSLMRIRLREMGVLWKLFDGCDWERTRTAARAQIEKLGRQKRNRSSRSRGDQVRETRDENENEDDDGTTTPLRKNKSPVPEPRDDVRKKPATSDATFTRSHDAGIEFHFSGIDADFDSYPLGVREATRTRLAVRDVEILDNLRTSGWRKFLAHLRPEESGSAPREKTSCMIRVDLNGVRPDPDRALEEYRMKASVLPIRLHVDQDALNFLVQFFTFRQMLPQGSFPATSDRTRTRNEGSEMYFQHCQFSPIVLKIDYKAKHVDYGNLFTDGNLVELLNFFSLDAAEMTLREVSLTGIKGFGRLWDGLTAAWLPHVRDTQLSSVVSGIGPLRSLVNIGTGAADMILLPIEQYRKDGRIVRGLQKGARSFVKLTTMETLKMGTRLAVGTQVLLEQADEILSFDSRSDGPDGPSSSAAGRRPSVTRTSSNGRAVEEEEVFSKFSEQPGDVKEGMESAYKSLSKNIGTAAHTIFAVPMEVYEKSGTQGTVRSVIRAVPVAVLKPMIGASEAVSKALMGIRNSIDPNQKLETEDKYKRRG